MKRFWQRGRGAGEQDPNQLPLVWNSPVDDGHAPSSKPASVKGGEAEGPGAIDSPLVTPNVPGAKARQPRRMSNKPTVVRDDVDREPAAEIPQSGFRRVMARLPVPRPLPASVAARRFGEDEDGHPIRPAADEVRAITENHAERLIDLLIAATAAVESGTRAEQARLRDAFGAAVADFAEDFGERPARQLEAYVRRQAALEEFEGTTSRR